MTMLQRVAKMAAGLLDQGTRDDGTRYVFTRDGAPEWFRDMTHAAHGDMLPDDWRYQKISDTLDALAQCDDTDEALAQVEEPDTYTGDLLAWLASHGHRPGYVDEACKEWGTDAGASITDRVQLGQMAEAREVFDSVLASLQDVIGDQLGADPDEDGDDLDDATIRAGLQLPEVA